MSIYHAVVRYPGLSRALTILAQAEAHELALHDEVDAFYAPSECHGLVARGEAERLRLARRRAEAAAGCPFRVLRRRAMRAAGIRPCSAQPRWQAIVGRVGASR
jgi:hypothetical protein